MPPVVWVWIFSGTTHLENVRQLFQDMIWCESYHLQFNEIYQNNAISGFFKQCSSVEASEPVCSEWFFVIQSGQYQNFLSDESFFLLRSLPFLLFSLSCGFEVVWSHKTLIGFSVVPVKMAKFLHEPPFQKSS